MIQVIKLQLSVISLVHYFLISILLLLTNCSIMGTSSNANHAKNTSYLVPVHWIETDSNGESEKAFKLSSGATVTLTSTCQSNRDNTLEALTKELLLGARKINYIKQEKISIANSQALFSEVTAHLEGVHFYLQFIVAKKNSCIFDFSLVSAKPISQKESEDFFGFAKSFNYGKS
ncbi:MAG: hypothetical protein EXR74_05825 [Bdellovibrionales bacterium]|nr:hypothetical protein [Bdellovibrionales bacterium]